jgi:hypothetical protein
MAELLEQAPRPLTLAECFTPDGGLTEAARRPIPADEDYPPLPVVDDGFLDEASEGLPRITDAMAWRWDALAVL